MSRRQILAIASILTFAVGCSKKFQLASGSDLSPSSSGPSSGQVSSGIGVTSVSANTFLSSLGINTHIDQGYSPQSYVGPLQYLGVRAIRSGASNTSGLILVHQQAGVMVDIFSNGDLTGITSVGKQLAAAGALLSFEGPNEPNNFTFTYNGQAAGGSGSWTPVAQYQRDLYAAVKSDAILKSYPVFGVSEEGAETSNVGLQFLTIPSGAGTTMPAGTQYADFVNIHNYVCSTNSSLYADNMAWNGADPTLNDVWDGLYTEVGSTWRGGFKGYTSAQLQTVPRVTTETGWDSVGGPGGERVQGVVLVNTYLAQFKRGWRYTFIYMLRDGEGGGGNQGVFNADSTPKLAATYIHNLTSILADNGTVPTPGKLNYSIATEPSSVHDLLLQKSNGVFDLVIWGESAKGSNNITVDLGGTHGTVKVYDVVSGTTAVQTLTNASQVPLTLTDHALVLEIAN